jgi:hypothetical protein
MSFADEVREELARENKFFAERAFSNHVVDYDDNAAVSRMIDSVMSLEDAEDELFDHYANEV